MRSAVRQFSILHFYSETHECHCLALFMCPPPSNLEPRECHCLALFANSPFSTFIRSPMNLLPSAVHASSTHESGAPRIYCLALFANSPFSTFFRSPMNVIAQRYSCILHQRVWSPAKLLRSAVRQFSILHFFRSPMNLLPSTVHASSTNESGAPRIYCLALFANSPVSPFFGAP